MLPRVVSVSALEPYRLMLRFDDGVEGEVDLASIIRFEGVFAQMSETAWFSGVRVDPDSGTIAWPNGADLDPIVLHSLVAGAQGQDPMPAVSSRVGTDRGIETR